MLAAPSSMASILMSLHTKWAALWFRKVIKTPTVGKTWRLCSYPAQSAFQIMSIPCACLPLVYCSLLARCAMSLAGATSERMSLCQVRRLCSKFRCQSSPRVLVRICTSKTQQSRSTSFTTWYVRDTRREAKTPARATQGDLLCARWRMGHGCRQAWWVLDLVVLIQTGQVCMPDWPATQASSAAQYRTYHCMVELITTGVEALWSCLAAWPPYWPCFTDETIWTMDFLEVVRLMKEKVHMYANLHMKP